MHGHYLDCHLTVPTLERLSVAAMSRVLGRPAERFGTVEDYEAVGSPVFAWRDAVARDAHTGNALNGIATVSAWRALGGGSTDGVSRRGSRSERGSRSPRARSIAARLRRLALVGAFPARRRRPQPGRPGTPAGGHLSGRAAPGRPRGDGRGGRPSGPRARPRSSSATPTGPGRCRETMSSSGAVAAGRGSSTAAAGPMPRSSSRAPPARAPTGRAVACSSRTTERPGWRGCCRSASTRSSGPRPRERRSRRSRQPGGEARRHAAHPGLQAQRERAGGVAPVLEQRVGARGPPRATPRPPRRARR